MRVEPILEQSKKTLINYTKHSEIWITTMNSSLRLCGSSKINPNFIYTKFMTKASVKRVSTLAWLMCWITSLFPSLLSLKKPFMIERESSEASSFLTPSNPVASNLNLSEKLEFSVESVWILMGRVIKPYFVISKILMMRNCAELLVL